MNQSLDSWLFWALLSAAFAALTAIFAKIGVENVNSDFATLVRTIVILAAAGAIVWATGHWQAPSQVSWKTWLFLVLSGAATGASWICYFRALKLGAATNDELPAINATPVDDGAEAPPIPASADPHEALRAEVEALKKQLAQPPP